MKKNYVYFIAPLAGLAIFTGIYWQYSATYENRLVEMHRRELEAAQKKLDEDAKNRKMAADTAYASQEKRKAEKKAKDAKDAADKDAREQAQAVMRKAQNDAGKLTSRVRVLEKDIKTEKAEIAKLEEDKKALLAEKAFQAKYVTQAEANVTALLATLDKVGEADKKWEEAQKAQAAAVKKQ